MKPRKGEILYAVRGELTMAWSAGEKAISHAVRGQSEDAAAMAIPYAMRAKSWKEGGLS